MAKAPKKAVTKSAPAAAAAQPEKAAASAKAANPKAPAKPAAAAPKAPAKPKTASRHNGAPPSVSPEQRYCMIQDAAYFIAERHGFVGDNHGYWLEAENAIDAQLGSRQGNP